MASAASPPPGATTTTLELAPVDRGTRSTLFVSRDGNLYRNYHDTDRWEAVPPRYDEGGVARCSSNRRVEAVARRAFVEAEEEEAATRSGGGGGGKRRYRGGGGRGPPEYVRRMLGCLAREPRDIDEVARTYGGIERSTAWNYVSRAVEAWPEAGQLARPLIHPPLWDALGGVAREGALRDLMQRLQAGPLRGDHDWRCLEDRYAHLRLARLCLDARCRTRAGGERA